jgi:hypothetical protein
MCIIVLWFVLAQSRTDELLKGHDANEDADIGRHGTQAEMSTRGACTTGTTENNAKAKVPSSAVPVTEVLTADTAKVPDGAKIPHQPEVRVHDRGIAFWIARVLLRF